MLNAENQDSRPREKVSKETYPNDASIQNSDISNSKDPVKNLQERIDAVRDTLNDSFHAAISRGSHLSDLERRAGYVEQESKAFTKTAVQAQKKLWWEENYETLKLAIIVVSIILGIVLGYIMLRILWVESYL